MHATPWGLQIAVGSLADLSVFSFHPVKHITTGEGGMITTDNEFRQTHADVSATTALPPTRQREERGPGFTKWSIWDTITESPIFSVPWFNQLLKFPGWIVRRQEIAKSYDEAFAGIPGVRLLKKRPEVSHAYHLYVIRLSLGFLGLDRNKVFQMLRERGIGANVHYIPVHLHPYYRKRFGTTRGLCPVAEEAYEEILSLPCFRDE